MFLAAHLSDEPVAGVLQVLIKGILIITLLFIVVFVFSFLLDFFGLWLRLWLFHYNWLSYRLRFRLRLDLLYYFGFLVLWLFDNLRDW